METAARYGESENFRRVPLDQDEIAHDAGRSLRTQRLTKSKAASVITRIKHDVMVFILFDESCVVVLTYFFRRVGTNRR